MSVQILKRLRSMDGAELRFRATAAIRSRVSRARTAIAPSTWRRESLVLADLPSLAEAKQALRRRDWLAAHRALARHFTSRDPRFPLDPRRLPELGREIISRFPMNDAVSLAERIVEGKYDLLGYRAVGAGSPPDWHLDAVHGRRAPLLFWDAVPYLDPACGDHKVIWEINRHQHLLVLGRGFVLTGDRRYYRTFTMHLVDWLRHNPPLLGINWSSMLELALRSLSWVWALHMFAAAVTEDDREPWVVDLLLALDRQLEHVEQNLSRYFSPNTHLTGEALALYVAGRVFPELPSSHRFEQAGRDVLLKEAHNQVLPDGGHAERSAHYHRYSTDFYLLAFAVARVTGDPAAAALRKAAHRQAAFLRGITNDRGCLPLIGDDDGGQLFPICRRPPSDASDTLANAAVLLEDHALAVGAPPEETMWLCGTWQTVPRTIAAPPQPSIGFPHSGYYVTRDGSGNHLVFDCGPHGFLNGGHAHADALAVNVSVRGNTLLVDAGTATYTMNPEMRDRFRATAMHNTVVVDGRSQSQPRGPFHWLTRTDARCRIWQPGGSADYVEGDHDGYSPTRHVRGVFAVHGIGWIVVDHLVGDRPVRHASAMWHIHPKWAWRRTGDNEVVFTIPGELPVALAMSVPLQLVRDGSSAFAPEYGYVTQALCLAGEFETASAAAFVAATPAWSDARVRPVAVDARPDGESRSAFRIDSTAGTFVVLSSTGAENREWGSESFRTSGCAALLELTPSGPVELCRIGERNLASSMQQVGRR
jgi:hypothetical protein